LPAPRDRLACRPRRPRKCLQARCINRVAEAWLHGPNKSLAGGTGLSSARACLRGGCGHDGRPASRKRRAAELVHRLPPQRVHPPRGPFAWRGWACRHEHPDQGRRLTSPIRAEPDKPAASTGGPAVGFEEEISLRRHPRNSRSTRLRDGPAFFAARFTLAFDFPVFFAS
jgi:hypothetical protein